MREYNDTMAPDNCKIDTMKQWSLDNYMREYNETMAGHLYERI